jgi:hypothetical protein
MVTCFTLSPPHALARLLRGPTRSSRSVTPVRRLSSLISPVSSTKVSSLRLPVLLHSFCSVLLLHSHLGSLHNGQGQFKTTSMRRRLFSRRSTHFSWRLQVLR